MPPKRSVSMSPTADASRSSSHCHGIFDARCSAALQSPESFTSSRMNIMVIWAMIGRNASRERRAVATAAARVYARLVG